MLKNTVSIKRINMNKIIYTILTLACIFLYSCKPTADEAGDYNDKLASIQIPIITATDEVEEAVYSYDKEEMYASLSKIEKQVDSSIEIVSKMGDLGGKTSFKDAALTLLKQTKEGLEKEIKPAMKINSKPIDDITEEDDMQVDKFIENFENRIIKYNELFLKEQEAQAKEYGYETEEVKTETKK